MNTQLKKPKKNSLANIANVMKKRALQNPRHPIKMGLNGGLHLTIIYKINKWQLSLVRANVYPSEAEVNVVLGVFNIPKNKYIQEKTVATQANITWHIIRLHWHSTNQLSFIVENNKVTAIINTDVCAQTSQQTQTKVIPHTKGG